MLLPVEHGTVPEMTTLALVEELAPNPAQRGTWPAATATRSSAARTRVFGAIVYCCPLLVHSQLLDLSRSAVCTERELETVVDAALISRGV